MGPERERLDGPPLSCPACGPKINAARGAHPPWTMQRPRSEHDLHLISGASISAESTQPAQHNTERQLQTEGHGRLWIHLSAFLCCEALKTCGRYPQPGKALGRVRDMSFCHGSAISREQGPKIWQASHHTDGQFFRPLFCGHVPEISLFSRFLVFVSHKTVEGKLLAFPKTYAHAHGHHQGARPRAVAAWRSSKSGRVPDRTRGSVFLPSDRSSALMSGAGRAFQTSEPGFHRPGAQDPGSWPRSARLERARAL